MDDQTRKKALEEELYRGVSEQIRHLSEQRKQEENIREEESRKLARLWEQMDEQKKKEAQEELVNRQKLAQQIKEFNKMKQEELEEAVRQERQGPLHFSIQKTLFQYQQELCISQLYFVVDGFELSIANIRECNLIVAVLEFVTGSLKQNISENLQQ